MRQLLVLPILFALAPLAEASEPSAGQRIYRAQCASCHGNAGEGTDEYPRRLEGKKSLDQLSAYVEKRMPKKKPETCTGEEARQVSKYIFDAFYSREAQLRRAVPRIELSRLTVTQHRNAVADLLGSFRRSPRLGDAHGLTGHYGRGSRPSSRRRVFQRIDPVVEFEFGTDSPDKRIPTEEFVVRWEGSVLAPETGLYDFVIRSANGARLWVNDEGDPLIDAWVRSGRVNIERGSVFLLGGRAYPIRLEFFKPRKAKEKTAAISLLWKPPHGVEQVIPTRHLVHESLPETFVLRTPFPPDDRSRGWERGTSISKEWDTATSNAALEVAGYVADHFTELVGVDEEHADAKRKVREFGQRFVETAFRHPLSDEERLLFVDRQIERAGSASLGLKRIVLLATKSPRFLYVERGDDLHSAAARLALNLWDSIPDQRLREASSSDALRTRSQVEAHARRMLDDPRAKQQLRSFFHTWLEMEHGSDLSKEPNRHPDFTDSVAASARTGLDLFVEDVVWSESHDFRRLFLSDEAFMDTTLAKFFGVGPVPEGRFSKSRFEPDKRAGVLTQPYFLSKLAYTASTSPIHRGVFLARNVLGVDLRPPPEAFTPIPEKLHPNLTTRERVVLQTKPVSCQECHGIVNPLGFVLEHFDEVGRFRDREKGKPIDSRGEFTPEDGKAVKFDGVKTLAKYLAQSKDVHAAFVERMFHHLAKQPVRAYGPDVLERLTANFRKNDFDILELVIDISVTAAMHAPKN